MRCWKCGYEMEDPPMGKVSFRAVCEKCCAGLHCCCNCIYHKIGAPNECAIPGTIHIVDREANNFCEDFKLKGTGPVKSGDPKEAERRLFGEVDHEEKQEKDPKKRFDSLF
jgi:hypothetical protein